ncbi:alpha/beta-hydrolase [Choiromyces venosus 120613-1]|uniref:Alpha/beta-hydrolase n=1 Tax=Choiromyces venosus 120613-1 TaxID=1336337 RepID=A0A3N4JHH9_9PEZI|nr:alpha/beta-hydrolase [Choiromyces venosus 120613-1]
MLPRTILALLAAYAAGVMGSPTGVPEAAAQNHTIEELLAMDADLIQTDTAAFSTLEAAPTISASTLATLYYYAEFSAVGYCDPGNVPGTEVTCKNNICPQVTANTVTTIIAFADTTTADTTGIVARDDTRKTITVVFRGSKSLKNWFANVRLLWKDASTFCSGCKLHSGFYNAFIEAFPPILASVNTLRAQYPSYKIAVTGHSLGGALATITATEFRRLGYTTELYTYGAPRVGNDKFSTFVSQSSGNFRVTHLNDPVPRLPPVAMGYYHISPEYWISRGDSNIKASDVEIYYGILNTGGNTGHGLISLNIGAHLKYFLPVGIATCGPLWDFDL